MESITRAPHSKAVIVLVHGMQEHSNRYQAFCDYLAQHGYSSVRYDLIGHGQNLPAQLKGYFGFKGWHNFIFQLHKYVQLAHREFPDQPVILFGHSMGTIIIRSYIQKYDDFDGMILSGTPFYNPLWVFGKLISSGIVMAKGAKSKSRLLDKLTTGQFIKKIPHPKTNLDWLSHNSKDVQSYIDDPDCGFSFTSQGYNDLYEGMREVGHLRYFHSNHPVPVLFLNGRDDPCAGKKSQVQSSLNMLVKAGYHDMTHHSYPQMRHEILFERDATVVMNDIVNWLERKVN
ncbi:MAG TPA: lysophospholipase [Candidatus Limosilactobacillus intestinavium]|nr:lysophospholipase [Candidatus Limosilactobacillus intestinavium]